MRTINLTRKVTRQARVVADHLREVGSLTQVEAASLYKIRSLSSRVSELRRAGADKNIRAVTKQDRTGQRYVRYIHVRT